MRVRGGVRARARVRVWVGVRVSLAQRHLGQRHPVDGDDAVALGHRRHLVGTPHLVRVRVRVSEGRVTW